MQPLGDGMLTARRLSRRQFLTRGAALGGAAMFAGPLAPGAIDLAGPSNRMTSQLTELALPEMQEAARQIMEVNAPFASRA